MAIFQKSRASPFVLERVADQVVLAHRGAAGCHQQVHAARAGGMAHEGLRVVAGDAEVDGLAAAAFRHGPERVGVGAHDLVRAQRLARHDDLVAGGEQRDARLAAHREPRLVHGGGEADGARVQPSTGRDTHLARAKIEPGGADVAARRRAFAHGDGVALRLGVLLNHDGVGAVRHRGAGEDAHRLTGADRAFVARAGRHAADLAQRDGRVRNIGGARRVAVHRRDGEGRLREAGDDIRCQHAAVGRGQGNGLRR